MNAQFQEIPVRVHQTEVSSEQAAAADELVALSEDLGLYE